MAASARPLDGWVVAFDLDGTLVDTAPDLIGTLNVLLEAEGHEPFALEDARPFIGRGAKWMIGRGFAAAGAPRTPTQIDVLFERFLTVYLGRIAQESRPFPGLESALDALAADGARLSVCTNKLTHLSVALMEALGLAHRFAGITGADAAPAPKPDPRHLIAAAEQAGGVIERTIMVGDAGTDAGAAKAAGAPLILVSFGYTETPVTELGADILIDHFDALPAACRRLAAARP